MGRLDCHLEHQDSVHNFLSVEVVVPSPPTDFRWQVNSEVPSMLAAGAERRMVSIILLIQSNNYHMTCSVLSFESRDASILMWFPLAEGRLNIQKIMI